MNICEDIFNFLVFLLSLSLLNLITINSKNFPHPPTLFVSRNVECGNIELNRIQINYCTAVFGKVTGKDSSGYMFVDSCVYFNVPFTCECVFLYIKSYR